MSQLYVATNFIATTSIFDPNYLLTYLLGTGSFNPAGVGLLFLGKDAYNFGHLQVVYQPVGATNLLQIEVQAPTGVILGKFLYSDADELHGDPTTYIDENDNIEDASRYIQTAITLAPEQSSEYVWELMEQIDASFKVHGKEIDYDLFQNSNCLRSYSSQCCRH